FVNEALQSSGMRCGVAQLESEAGGSRGPDSRSRLIEVSTQSDLRGVLVNRRTSSVGNWDATMEISFWHPVSARALCGGFSRPKRHLVQTKTNARLKGVFREYLCRESRLSDHRRRIEGCVCAVRKC